MNRKLRENSRANKQITIDSQQELTIKTTATQNDRQQSKTNIQIDFHEYMLPKLKQQNNLSSQNVLSKHDALKLRFKAAQENRLNNLFKNDSPKTERSSINETNLCLATYRNTQKNFYQQYFLKKYLKEQQSSQHQQQQNQELRKKVIRQASVPRMSLDHDLKHIRPQQYIRSSLDQVTIPILQNERFLIPQKKDINVEYFKFHPSAQEKTINQLKYMKSDFQKDIQKKNNHNNSINQSQELITERSVQYIKDNQQNHYLNFHSSSQPSLNKISFIEKNITQKKNKPQYVTSLNDIDGDTTQSVKRHPNIPKLDQSKQYGSYPSIDKSGIEAQPSLLEQLGGEEALDKVITKFKSLYELKQHLKLNYDMLKCLLLIIFDRDKVVKQKYSSSDIRMHFKNIGLGQFHYINIFEVIKLCFEELTDVPLKVIRKCLNKLENPQKFMLNVTLLEEIGGEEAIVDIVNNVKDFIEQKDEIMSEVLFAKNIQLNEKTKQEIVDFLKFILIDPTIYQQKLLLENVQPLEFQYLDFFRIKFIIEKQFRLNNWSEFNIQLALFRLENFRFFILQTPPFYQKIINSPQLQKEIIEDLYASLKRNNYIYHLCITNKVKLETIYSFVTEIFKFLALPLQNRDFFSVLKPFRQQQQIMSIQFFEIFLSQITDILKFYEFDLYFILEIKKKIQILLFIENIIIPLAKKLPKNSLKQIQIFILELFEEQLQVSQTIEKETLQQVVKILLFDSFGQLANDIMPIYLPIWDLQAIKIWFRLDSLWLETFKQGIDKYFKEQQIENSDLQKEINLQLKQYFQMIFSLK
ncbi:hypothetical protein ABPG74_013311 [Tetrahymena malaccensis]